MNAAEKIRHQAELSQYSTFLSPAEIVVREMTINSFRGKTYAHFYHTDLGCPESELEVVAKVLKGEGFYTRVECDGFVGDQLEVSALRPFED